MATSVRLLRRYVWLVDTIRRAGRLTLEEINSRWMDERTLRLDNEKSFPERTFHRHRQAISDIFGIEIVCNRYDGNTYYIENEDALNEPSFSSWLFNGLAIDNRLLQDRDTAGRIRFEETPGGTEFLSPIIDALTKNIVIKVTYRRFDSTENSIRALRPYGLRQSGRRWYLVATNESHSSLAVFALDRFEDVELTSEKFKPDPSLSPNAFFDEVIGVNVDDDYDCERVVLRVFGRQRDYIETLPLHKSQRLIDHTKNHSDYELTIRPEYEFQRAVLALGPEAEIISPSWLRDEIKWLIEETAKRYN